MSDILVGIDIGTSKVCTVIGKVGKSNNIEILGKGIEVCNGIKNGTIVDIETMSKAIKTSLNKAEVMSNFKVGSAFVNIMGTQVDIIPNKASVEISKKSREITPEDVEEVLNTVEGVEISQHQQIIDVAPRQFIIDGCEGIKDPIGMFGTTLGVEADVVVGKITTVQNILKSFELANIKVDGLIVEPLAIGEMTLTSQEKDMGVIQIDVGGTMTNISIFEEEELVFYTAIPIGGNHITNDISMGLKISLYDAERLKREYELALTSLIKNDQEITVSELNSGERKNIRVSQVVEIIEARVHEIFLLSKEKIHECEMLKKYSGGIVLSGAGISYVDGGKQLANEVFELPVRVHSYKGLNNLKPESITGAGIIKYAVSQKRGNKIASEVVAIGSEPIKEKPNFLRKLAKIFNSFF